MPMLSSYLIHLFNKEKQVNKVYTEEFVISISDHNYSESFDELKESLRQKIKDERSYYRDHKGDVIYKYLQDQIKFYVNGLRSNQKESEFSRKKGGESDFIKSITDIEIQNVELRQGSLQLVFSVIMHTLEAYSTLSELVKNRETEVDMQFDLLGSHIQNDLRFILGGEYSVSQYHKSLKRQSDSDNLLPVLINQIQKGSGSSKFQSLLILGLAASLGLNTYLVEDTIHFKSSPQDHYREIQSKDLNSDGKDVGIKVYLNGKENVQIGEFHEEQYNEAKDKAEKKEQEEHLERTDSIEIILKKHH